MNFDSRLYSQMRQHPYPMLFTTISAFQQRSGNCFRGKLLRVLSRCCMCTEFC